jgi:hypothetical protein
VVNEALNEDGTMRKSIFLDKLGDDFVTEAFRIAQKAAPNTNLYYNDYNIEQPKKRAGAIALIKKIQAAGVRIDGVGIQGHWHLNKIPLKEIEESIQEFSALGIKVMFTELDIEVLKRDFQGADVSGFDGLDGLSNPMAKLVPTGDPVPRFDESVPFVLLHPFARGQRKSLSDLVIDEFCRVLSPSRVVLVGLSNRTFPVRENCVSLINQTTLLQLIWLIRAARFTVSVDSGPMHIASALSERLVSIHTWSDPRRVGPYNPDAWIWKGGDLLRVRELQSAPKRHRSKRAFKMSDVDKLMPLLREHLGRSP